MKKVFFSLLTLLFFSFGTNNSLLKSNKERFIPAVSLRLDNNFSKYEKYFINETEFWIKAFTLDSSKTLVYKRETMEILNTINTPSEEREELVIDSIYNVYREDREEKTLGIIFGRRQKMKRAVKRAFDHLDYIVDSLEAHELSTSLAVIPFFESEFRNDANSKAGAVGMWQFRKETARDFGLKVDNFVDERKDSKKSLSAFIRYMEKANERFDSDLLALVSYNTGLYSKYFRERDIKGDVDLVKNMGFAPRHYAASFFASLEILKDPLRYYDLDLE